MPMAVLWTASMALVFGYYFVPGVAAMLAPLKSWQDAWIGGDFSLKFWKGHKDKSKERGLI